MSTPDSKMPLLLESTITTNGLGIEVIRAAVGLRGAGAVVGSATSRKSSGPLVSLVTVNASSCSYVAGRHVRVGVRTAATVRRMRRSVSNVTVLEFTSG